MTSRDSIGKPFRPKVLRIKSTQSQASFLMYRKWKEWNYCFVSNKDGATAADGADNQNWFIHQMRSSNWRRWLLVLFIQILNSKEQALDDDCKFDQLRKRFQLNPPLKTRASYILYIFLQWHFSFLSFAVIVHSRNHTISVLGHSPALFYCIFSTFNRTYVDYKILLMTGFELLASDIQSDRSAN